MATSLEKRILVVGDVSAADGNHCTPSTAVGGLNTVLTINDVPVIVIGDTWTQHGHTSSDCTPTPKTQGTASSNLYVNGMRVALSGDLLNCGAITL